VNPQFRLKPGMYAKVTFIVDKRDQVLVIPLTALADVGGNRGVFLDGFRYGRSIK
jgi:multidrug efflux pump subunit AcrA (membrane-fusion protein)